MPIKDRLKELGNLNKEHPKSVAPNTTTEAPKDVYIGVVLEPGATLELMHVPDMGTALNILKHYEVTGEVVIKNGRTTTIHEPVHLTVMEVAASHTYQTPAPKRLKEEVADGTDSQ